MILQPHSIHPLFVSPCLLSQWIHRPSSLSSDAGQKAEMLVSRHMGHVVLVKGTGLLCRRMFTGRYPVDVSRLPSNGVKLCAQLLHWALIEVDGLKSDTGYQWHLGHVISSML